MTQIFQNERVTQYLDGNTIIQVNNPTSEFIEPIIFKRTPPQDKSGKPAGWARTPKNPPPSGETPCKTLEAYEDPERVLLRRSAGAALNDTATSVACPSLPTAAQPTAGIPTGGYSLSPDVVSTAGG